MLPQSTLDAAASVLQSLRQRGWRLATAESCTGGLVAGALTHVAGSSDVFDRGFVTYSNDAKTELLGVADDLIGANGAVSEAVARAMATGALARSRASLAVSVTGVAGPGGGSVDKPVGLVWFGWGATRCAGDGGSTNIYRRSRICSRSGCGLRTLDRATRGHHARRLMKKLVSVLAGCALLSACGVGASPVPSGRIPAASPSLCCAQSPSRAQKTFGRACRGGKRVSLAGPFTADRSAAGDGEHAGSDASRVVPGYRRGVRCAALRRIESGHGHLYRRGRRQAGHGGAGGAQMPACRQVQAVVAPR